MNKSMLAGAALVAALAVPVLAWSAGENDPAGGPMRHRGWMHQETQRSPQQACEERIARRAGFAAYVAARLNLTAEQKPLWDKMQAAMQTAGDKQRQVCATLKPAAERGEQTALDRMSRREQMLSAQLEGLQQVEPAFQALYQSLTPEQKAIVDHPHRRG